MSDDFYTRTLNAQIGNLRDARRTIMNEVERYKRMNDHEGAAEYAQDIANLDAQERAIVDLHNRHVAQNQPAAPLTDAEFMALSPERMAQHPEAVDRIFSKSKYYDKNQWSDPNVQRLVREGVAEAQRRRTAGQ
jgi:hypothetical protein